MSPFNSFKTFIGMLFGPDHLCESREDIIKRYFILSVGVKKTLFAFVLDS